MNILTVSHLSKQFGNFKAVKDVSFSLKEGEILGFLGPNGAGKTTTIQMLLGVLTPTSGTIHYFGKDFITNREAVLESVNFSSTYTNMPWNLSVKENLTYISYLYDLPQRKKNLEEIIEVFKLKSLLHQTMSQLSAGQMTRVNLAKAFINQPKVLLLDEPTASLDPEIAQYIREYLMEKQKEKKISVIFTSHNMPEVEMICDRVLFINQGTIFAEGTPAALAKSLDFCRVHFSIKKASLQNFLTYSEKYALNIKKEGNFYIIETKENKISSLLEGFVKAHIAFDEISIDKPTLEDFFLHHAQQKPKSFEHIT